MCAPAPITEQLFEREGTPRKANSRDDKGNPLFISPRTCSRCGGAGGSIKWEHTGWTCYQCSGKGVFGTDRQRLYTADKLAALNVTRDKRRAKKAAEAAERKATEDARRLRERDEVIAAHKDILARIRKTAPDKLEEGFFASIIAQVEVKAKALSDRQMNAVEAALDKIDIEQQRLVTARHIGTVGERMTLTGTVDLIREFDDGFGGSKFLIVLKVEGSKVVYWGKSFSKFGIRWDHREECFIKPTEPVSIKATIKEHGVSRYNDEPETTITRPAEITE